MKNRALLLCLKNKIDIETYCEKVGVDSSTADLIFKDQYKMDESLIYANCELFGVSKEYFLCKSER